MDKNLVNLEDIMLSESKGKENEAKKITYF